MAHTVHLTPVPSRWDCRLKEDFIDWQGLQDRPNPTSEAYIRLHDPYFHSYFNYITWGICWGKIGIIMIIRQEACKRPSYWREDRRSERMKATSSDMMVSRIVDHKDSSCILEFRVLHLPCPCPSHSCSMLMLTELQWYDLLFTCNPLRFGWYGCG